MSSPNDTQHGPSYAQVGSAYYPIFVAVFTALVIISNVTATKGVEFGPIITDGGFIVFPLTYVIGDVLSEVYGFKAARRAILTGFAMNALAAAAFWATVYLPAADFYPNQEHLENIVSAYTGLIIAGMAGFLVGQTLNAWSLVLIKERTKEKHLWARLVGSTFVGQLGDTVVFCAIAASVIGITTFSDFLIYTAQGWFYKTIVEVVLLPITYRVIAMVKRREPTYQPVT
ncbi:queuosine precursor transporter [Mycolicibacterium neoaurum]|uniref:queuosine precursor transporter n=1 Tax=Mycolicibacterium neoaurum TaxID=1795 RepID=UPI00248C9B02|nr:queuosine precursor transporter [Mycolicibacterium neoaurum]WBP93708.1 queuosine precursor transporter [Mycolicibacterium neoaurum]WBS07515.1 queuosine precursor transporter [Mycolicibacterium neoaurum]